MNIMKKRCILAVILAIAMLFTVIPVSAADAAGSGDILNELQRKLLDAEPASILIAEQPESVSGAVGDTVRFTLRASRAGSTYQWQNSLNGSTWINSGLTGCTTATITIPVTEVRYKYVWRCVVRDPQGNSEESAVVAIVKPPVLQQQPVSVAGSVGDVVKFTAIVSGSGLKYQWQNSLTGSSWTNSGLEGCTTSTITIPVTTVRYPYYWRCVVTDAAGQILTTNSVQILRPVTLVIKTQPTNVKANVGENVQFSVVAEGGGLKYQWQNSLDGTNWANSGLTGYNTATITIPVTEARYPYYWRCVVKDNSGSSLTTESVQIQRNTIFAITKQPESVKANVGETIQFQVTAEGSGLRYQWQNSQNGTSWANSGLTGFNTATITIPVTEARYPFYWRCVVKDSSGSSLTTDSVQIQRKTIFAITKQPESVKANVGETIQFKVTAEGSGLRYQWQNSLNGTSWANSGLTGFNTATITIPVTEARYPYYWRCEVKDSNGNSVLTNSVQIQRNVILAITKQPESVTANVGDTIQFKVTADGSGLKYQWQNSLNGSTWSNSGLTGFSTATITIPVTAVRYDYYWHCIITDASGQKVTTEAVKIQKPAVPTEFSVTNYELTGGVLEMDAYTAVGTVYSLNVNCNKAWTVTTSDVSGSGWLNLSSGSGSSGNTTLALSVIKVPSRGETYTSTLTFKVDGEVVETITVRLTKPLTLQPAISVSSAEGKKGDMVAVKVSVADNPGIVSMSLKVSYDTAALKLVDVSDAGAIPGSMHSNRYNSPYSLVWENDTSRTDYTAEGVYATLTFEILTDVAGDYGISLAVPKDGILNYDCDEVNFRMVNGICTVISGK